MPTRRMTRSLALLVTGTPIVTLQVSSTHEDAAFLVYLEDVAPDGRSRYITEGGLRAVHRSGARPSFIELSIVAGDRSGAGDR